MVFKIIQEDSFTLSEFALKDKTWGSDDQLRTACKVRVRSSTQPNFQRHANYFRGVSSQT